LFNEICIKSRIKFLSNLPTPARWKKDAVNQQLKELKMKKGQEECLQIR
tara:strand:- start:393 stop:539 length:147 start_codon:yes stop_codon:yes gene_type:complete